MFVSAVFTLSESVLVKLSSAGKLKGGQPVDESITDVDTLNQVSAIIEEVNRELASYEQIKKFVVLGREFSIAEGEMTPTLKMKRNVVESRFKTLIDAMYG